MNNNEITPKQSVVRCWYVGADRVNGRLAVKNALNVDGIDEIKNICAIGKAASSMFLGASPKLSNKYRGLLVTKSGHVDDAVIESKGLEVIEAGHPIPDENSLIAGKKLYDFVQSIPVNEDMVMLVSGGASALVEKLVSGIDLQELITTNEKLIASGMSIDEINQKRNQLSEIKGGKLLENFRGKKIQVYAISDVPGDDLKVIGSGIGWAMLGGRYRSNVVATNKIAREEIEGYAKKNGHKVVLNESSLSQDVNDAATMIGQKLRDGIPGIYIWGGETTIALPKEPGHGGRNQSLGLAIAKEIQGRDITVIAAGTDGTDGPTENAGAVVDGKTFLMEQGGSDALQRADAETFLKKVDGLFICGPTGTNVMDLVVGLKL